MQYALPIPKNDPPNPTHPTCPTQPHQTNSGVENQSMGKALRRQSPCANNRFLLCLGNISNTPLLQLDPKTGPLTHCHVWKHTIKRFWIQHCWLCNSTIFESPLTQNACTKHWKQMLSILTKGPSTSCDLQPKRGPLRNKGYTAH